jgi:DNA topoisomerase-2
MDFLGYGVQPAGAMWNGQGSTAQATVPNNINPQVFGSQQLVREVGGEEYQRLEHADQIRLRPDTYIGASTGISTDGIWSARIVGKGTLRTEPIDAQVAKAIIGVSKEIFDNATDNVIRSRTEGIDPGGIDVLQSQNSITVRNHGKYIPIVIHHKEGIWTPQLLFGVLLTSDNYNDSIARFKVGRNGYGIKLANIFSDLFQVVIGDPERRLRYTQIWTGGMKQRSEPLIEQGYMGPGFTEITFVPDFAYFYETDQAQKVFLDTMNGVYLNRTLEMSWAVNVKTTFNGVEHDYRDTMTYFNTHFASLDPSQRRIHWKSEDGLQEFVVAETAKDPWVHAFVNGTPVHAGVHVNDYLKAIFDDLADDFEKKHKKKLTVLHFKKHCCLLLRVMVNQPKFDSQIKRKLEKPASLKVQLPKAVTKQALKWDIMIDELKKAFSIKDKDKKDVRLRPQRVDKVIDALQANSSDPRERLKCTLFLTEGETGKTLFSKGCRFLPGGIEYNGGFPLRGKTMNVDRYNEEDVRNNKVLSNILTILNADPAIDYYKEPQKCNLLRYGKIGLMMDADYDGFHIDGLLINFIYSELRTLAPFEFVVILMTPVIEGTRGRERLTFYHQKQHAKWCRENDASGWDWKYKKGLGGWNTDPATLKRLFENPVIVTMEADAGADDVLKLAFHKKLTDERKKWIAAYNPDSEVVLRTPRPVSDFFMEEFRDYSKASVIRAIPRLMDGMKPVHRKILYTMFKKYPIRKKGRKFIKVPQIGGSVMEIGGYHHGEQALFTSIGNMAQNYITGPNNLQLLEGEGNFGDRRLRGLDASKPRYLSLRLHSIARYIYREEDDRLWEIQYDDGSPVEPKEMYPVIPMALVNKCEGIGTGWNCKIYPHDPRVVIEWVRQWVQEKKAKRHIPKEELNIDVSTKPELVPWWRDYDGRLVRVKNTPFEAYRNEGRFRYQFHTVFVEQIPAEMSIDDYDVWGKKQEDRFHEKPEEAILRTFTCHAAPPFIDFRITGMSNPTVERLNLVRVVSMSRLTLIDSGEIPKTYNYVFEIMCDWCLARLDIYEKRRLSLVSEYEGKVRLLTLKYFFIMDVVEGRLELRGRPKSEVIPYMLAKGYPCGQNKTKRKKKAADDEDDEDEGVSSLTIKDKNNHDFLSIPIGTITLERAQKLRNQLEAEQAKLVHYQNVIPEDLWLSDLSELQGEIEKLYRTPLY